MCVEVYPVNSVGVPLCKRTLDCLQGPSTVVRSMALV